MPVPAAVALAPAALGLVSNAVQGIGAGGQLKKDKAELARLGHPFYKIQDEYINNNNQAAYDSLRGFTQGARDLYTDQLDSGLGSSLEAVTETGGGANDIASIFSSYSSGLRNFAAEDSEKQMANIRYFQQTAKDLAGQKTTQWTVNEYQPYQNKLKEMTQRIQADKMNIHNAIEGGIGAIQAGVTSMQNNSLLKNLFPDGGGGIAEVASGATGGGQPFSTGTSTAWAGKFKQPGGIDYANVIRQMMSGERTEALNNMSEDDFAAMMEMIRSSNRPKE